MANPLLAGKVGPEVAANHDVARVRLFHKDALHGSSVQAQQAVAVDAGQNAASEVVKLCGTGRAGDEGAPLAAPRTAPYLLRRAAVEPPADDHHWRLGDRLRDGEFGPSRDAGAAPAVVPGADAPPQIARHIIAEHCVLEDGVRPHGAPAREGEAELVAQDAVAPAVRPLGRRDRRGGAAQSECHRPYLATLGTAGGAVQVGRVGTAAAHHDVELKAVVIKPAREMAGWRCRAASGMYGAGGGPKLAGCTETVP